MPISKKDNEGQFSRQILWKTGQTLASYRSWTLWLVNNVLYLLQKTYEHKCKQFWISSILAILVCLSEELMEFIHFVSKHIVANFLALSLPCMHMYAFRVPSSLLVYVMSSIDTPLPNPSFSPFSFVIVSSYYFTSELTLSDL